MNKETDEDALEPRLKRMSKVWTGREERVNILKVRVTATQRQEN